MVNPHNVLKVLLNLTSDRLSCNSPSSINPNEEHIALKLYKCLESIMESISHIFERETTLDHDDELDDEDLEDLLSSTSIHDHSDTVQDIDYELIDNMSFKKTSSWDIPLLKQKIVLIKKMQNYRFYKNCMLVSLEQSGNGMNPFEVFLCSMNPNDGRNMSSNEVSVGEVPSSDASLIRL